MTITALVDVDNQENRGDSQPRAVFDVRGFGAAMRKRGVSAGVAFQHYRYSALSADLWRSQGFLPVSTRENADRHIVVAATQFVAASCRHLILVTSDGDFTDLVHFLRTYGVRIDVFGHRGRTSRSLMRAASSVEYVDQWITEPSLITA